MLKKLKKNKLENILTVCLICFVVLLCLAINLKNWRYELPNHIHVDEEITVTQVSNLINGDSITAYNYPHLGFYYGWVCYKLMTILGVNIGNLSYFLRCAFGFLSILSNISLYFVLKLIFKKRSVAIIGFVLGTFSLYPYMYLYYSGPDLLIYSTANITIGLTAITFSKDINLKYENILYVLTGISFGLTVASKYHGVFLFIFIFILFFYKFGMKNKKENIKFAIMLSIAFLTFWVIMVQALINPSDFLKGIMFDFHNYSTTKFPSQIPALTYLSSVLFEPYRYLGLILILGGIVLIIIQRRHIHSITVGYFMLLIVCLLVLGRYKVVLPRNMALIAGWPIIVISYSVNWAICNRRLLIRAIAYSFVLFLAILNISTEIRYLKYEVSFDVAEEWIENNIPQGSWIYLEDYSIYAPVIDRNKYYVVGIYETDSFSDPGMIDGSYYITSSYHSGRMLRKKDYVFFKSDEYYLDKDTAERYTAFLSNLTELKTFESIRDDTYWRRKTNYTDTYLYSFSDYYSGPTISIYVKEE